MNMSETYKTTDINDINRLAVSATNTPNLMSETFYKQDKGSETADYSYNYQVGTLNIKSTSVFFYGTNLERAFETDPEEAMSRSLGYKWGKSVTDETVFYLVDKSIADLVQLTSETYYFGDIKGEEIANYAYNYQTKKDSSDAYIASTAKTTSVYYYDSRRATDPLVPSETAMILSETYKVIDIDLIERRDDVPGVDLNGDGDYLDAGEAAPNDYVQNLMSETFYKQDKGSETADYSYNYQVGTLNIKSTSVFFYGTNLERAFETDPEEAMSRSLGYKWGKSVTDETVFYLVDKSIADLVQLTSETYYFGDIKGEEIANYAYNYQTKKDSSDAYIASTAKTTSVYYYDSRRATDPLVPSETAMILSETYKVIDIDLIERRDDVPGVDLNGDGDYLDAGEAAPIDYV